MRMLSASETRHAVGQQSIPRHGGLLSEMVTRIPATHTVEVLTMTFLDWQTESKRDRGQIAQNSTAYFQRLVSAVTVGAVEGDQKSSRTRSATDGEYSGPGSFP